MSEEPLPSGWLPPRAPGAGPPPRFDAPAGAPERPDAGGVPEGPPAGWSPPQPTPHPTTSVPSRAPGDMPRRPAREEQPGSPAAMAGIVLGSIAIVLLVLSAGVAFLMAALLAATGLMLARRARRQMLAGAPGRASQAKAAVVVSTTALGLALVAGVVWVVLSASGITPQDLQESLERALERRRGD